MVGAVLDVVGQNVAVAIHPSAHGFQTAAGDYERARPDYSDEAGRWLAERLDLRPGQGRGHCGGDGQADASAGGHGRKVVAVEPVAGMRERLAAALTRVELLDGVAEAIPLDDASVHARDGRAGVSLVRRRSGTDRDPSRRSRGRPGWQSSITAAARASDSGSARGDPSPTRRSNARPRSLARRVRALAPLDSGPGGRAPACPAARPRGHSRPRGPTSFIAELAATAARTSSIKSEHLSKDASEPIELPSVCELFVWQHLPQPRDEARAKFRLHDRQKCPSVAVSVKVPQLRRPWRHSRTSARGPKCLDGGSLTWRS